MQMSSRSWYVIGALVVAAGCSKSDGAVPAPGPVAAPVTASAKAPEPVAAERLIVPKHAVGAITRTTDRRMFDKLFPRDTLTHLSCDLGEEEQTPCSRVQLDGQTGLLVLWDYPGKAEEVHVYSDAFATTGGVRVGIALTELVACNRGKPVTLVNSYVVGPDGGGREAWQVEDFGEGPLKDSGLRVALYVEGATAARLSYVDAVSSSDARLAGAEIHVTSIEVPLDGTPREVSVEGGEEEEEEEEVEERHDGELIDLDAPEGDVGAHGTDVGVAAEGGGAPDVYPTVVATLPAGSRDVRSVRWSTLDFRCASACSPTVKTVVYGDVEGDGTEEAVVVTTGGVVHTGDAQTANLYGVRAGAVVWLGRVQLSGFEHPEYAPTFIAAKLGGGTLKVTWRYHLWGEFDNPKDDVETRVETFAFRADRIERIAASEP